MRVWSGFDDPLPFLLYAVAIVVIPGSLFLCVAASGQNVVSLLSVPAALVGGPALLGLADIIHQQCSALAAEVARAPRSDAAAALSRVTCRRVSPSAAI